MLQRRRYCYICIVSILLYSTNNTDYNPLLLSQVHMRIKQKNPENPKKTNQKRSQRGVSHVRTRNRKKTLKSQTQHHPELCFWPASPLPMALFFYYHGSMTSTTAAAVSTATAQELCWSTAGAWKRTGESNAAARMTATASMRERVLPSIARSVLT